MTFLSDKKKEKKTVLNCIFFSKKNQRFWRQQWCSWVEMGNDGVELHSKNNGTTQRKMEEWQNNAMHMQKKIHIDTYLHHNTLCLFACTLYQQPTQHNWLSFLLSRINSVDTFLPSGISSFTFWWGYYENVLQWDKAAQEDKTCRIHLDEISEIVQHAETQGRAVTAWPGAGEGKWDSCYSLGASVRRMNHFQRPALLIPGWSFKWGDKRKEKECQRFYKHCCIRTLFHSWSRRSQIIIGDTKSKQNGISTV